MPYSLQSVSTDPATATLRPDIVVVLIVFPFLFVTQLNVPYAMVSEGGKPDVPTDIYARKFQCCIIIQQFFQNRVNHEVLLI